MILSTSVWEEDAASNGVWLAKTVERPGATLRHLVGRPVVVIIDNGA